MGEENGKVDSALRDMVAEMKAREELRRRKVLQDLSSDYPNLRNWLAGVDSSGNPVPSGQLTIEAADGLAVFRMQWFAFSQECSYTGDSFFGTLELIEVDLTMATTKWRSDYRRRKAKQDALRKDLD